LDRKSHAYWLDGELRCVRIFAVHGFACLDHACHEAQALQSALAVNRGKRYKSPRPPPAARVHLAARLPAQSAEQALQTLGITILPKQEGRSHPSLSQSFQSLRSFPSCPPTSPCHFGPQKTRAPVRVRDAHPCLCTAAPAATGTTPPPPLASRRWTRSGGRPHLAPQRPSPAPPPAGMA
jgi:hypothetical protein